MRYLKLLRVKHYIKNALIFLPVIFGGAIFDRNRWIYLVIGFVTFSLMSSVVYIINDIKDVEKDRRHEKKKERPIAAGQISIKAAIGIAVLLFIVSLLINIVIWMDNLLAVAIMIGYFLINLYYSVGGGKKIPLLDVVLLVSGFLLRVYYGAVISDIGVSGWLYMVIMTGAFYMGFGKRRNELLKNQDATRDVLKYYTPSFLDKSMNSCQTLAIVFYSLWCLDRTNATGTNYLITVPIVMLIFFKYSLSIENVSESDADPVEVILRDKVLVMLGMILAICMLVLLYGC